MAGTVFALVATSANLFGLAAPIVTGYIVKETGSFAIAFNLLGVTSSPPRRFPSR